MKGRRYPSLHLGKENAKVNGERGGSALSFREKKFSGRRGECSVERRRESPIIFHGERGGGAWGGERYDPRKRGLGGKKIDASPNESLKRNVFRLRESKKKGGETRRHREKNGRRSLAFPGGCTEENMA